MPKEQHLLELFGKQKVHSLLLDKPNQNLTFLSIHFSRQSRWKIVADLDSYFSTGAFDEAREVIFHEAIQEADATIEGKI